ncbi:tripeptidyl-peptidase 1 precursor [Aulographum hederae CBS 113979]|uniref:tripeptidyl-peptidase II n=1 Tax=Aulographum hederae CBS 113979 TaxID=1176131 RepID=A0A6G1HEC6_9PEZI|nr:tripeptidyl-peptidase 1 precursor [Aulographum hederae CBS 113979]
MHFSNVVPLLLSAIGAVQASPVTLRSPYAVKERHTVPRGWQFVGRAPKSDLVNLHIGLKQRNEGVVEQHLIEVSDPNHSRYGQHLSAEEIENIVTPSDDTINLVVEWLRENEVTSHAMSSSKDWISVLLPIEKVESLLQTKYSTFKHKDGTTVSRAPEWSLPGHLHEHIDVVQPTTSFFRPMPREVESRDLQPRHVGSKPLLDDVHFAKLWWANKGKLEYGQGVSFSGSSPESIAKACNISFTTIDCVRKLYGTIDYKPKATSKNAVGITNYLNETNYRADVKLFLETFRPEAVEAASTFPITVIANGDNDQGPYTEEQVDDGKNLEGNLDAEWVLGMSWPTPMVSWVTGGSPPFNPDINTPTNTNEPYLVWLNYVLGQKKLPQVISTSYGDDEQTVPESYAKRVCAGFAQLGARGISVLFSSGDAGVGSDGTCFSNTDPTKAMFLPAFPAGCPWVTAVGGTEAFQPEVAVQRFASGAGFSNYFSAPAYQSKTVNAYIKSLNGLHDGLYNKSGRGYPDVAAQGNHDAIAWNGIIRTIGGTSASSPTFAAVIGLVNDALIAKGKPSLGFLNPWIYGGAYKTLTDVTSGSSYGCNTTGFPAQPGWDAVTGFGTPNFPKLVQAAMSKGGHGHGGW